MITPKTAARLRSTRDGQELIAHIKQAIQLLNVTITEIDPHQTLEAIATDVVSRKRAIEVLDGLFHDLTAEQTSTNLREQRATDAGLA